MKNFYYYHIKCFQFMHFNSTFVYDIHNLLNFDWKKHHHLIPLEFFFKNIKTYQFNTLCNIIK